MGGHPAMRKDQNIPRALVLAVKEGAKVTKRRGISIVNVESQEKGLLIAKKILYFLTSQNPNSLLFLSGSTTPKSLYEKLAQEHKLSVGAVAMVDERYDPTYKNSNEKMIRKTGLIDDLKSRGIPFYPVLQREAFKHSSAGVSVSGKDMDLLEFFAQRYHKILLELSDKKGSAKSIAIMGVGKDGHTAGLAPDRLDFKNPMFYDGYFNSFNDPKTMEEGGFGKRMTLTLYGLMDMDFLVVLVFGEKKKEALKRMFAGGDLAEVPARFYTHERMAQKTILITDQKGLK